jgi:hypothetical protein
MRPAHIGICASQFVDQTPTSLVGNSTAFEERPRTELLSSKKGRHLLENAAPRKFVSECGE